MHWTDRIAASLGSILLSTDKKEYIMEKKNYVPQPVDTTDVELPEELYPLVETMAKNVHDVWAKSRIEEGWTWGEKRDDTLKHHPCLVTYEDLPEAEREYDRNTAIGTLKLIVKLGFTIKSE